MPLPCPCGSSKLFECCCGPYLKNCQLAPTPEALMRSRYTAFVKRKFAYLAKTMRGEALQRFDIESARKDAELIEWLQLEVICAKTHQDTGTVEFKAHFRYRRQLAILHEVSDFEKHQDQWFYVRGLIQ